MPFWPPCTAYLLAAAKVDAGPTAVYTSWRLADVPFLQDLENWLVKLYGLRQHFSVVAVVLGAMATG